MRLRRSGRLGAISSSASFIRSGHLAHERSKSNYDFGRSLAVASDTIERLPDLLQIWRFSAEPV
jgi:hypothetical protein